MKKQTNYEPGLDPWRVLPIESYEVGSRDLHRIGGLVPISTARFNSLEANIPPQDYPVPDHDRRRTVVACGMGTDSVGMLIAMKNRGIRPDVVQWADTGSERLETYRYVSILQAWLRDHGFPPLLVVRTRCPIAGHRSLYDQLWNTKQYPSPVFHRNHSCSIKWKLQPQRAYHEFLPWMFCSETAIGFAHGEDSRRGQAKEFIGFSHGENGRLSYEIKEEDRYLIDFPLQRWLIDRAGCMALIDDEGLPQPGKSSCFFCPMCQKCEIKAMRPAERGAAFALEHRVEAGGKIKKYRGLRKGSDELWSEWLAREDDAADQREFVGLTSDLGEG